MLNPKLTTGRVLGHESIKKRLSGLEDLGIKEPGVKVLELCREKKQPEELKIARGSGKIVVDPPYTEKDLKKLLGNVSLDLELGKTLRIHTNPHSHPVNQGGMLQDPIVDLDDKDTLKQIEKHDVIFELSDDKPYILTPRSFVKAITHRIYWLPYDLVGLMEGRSRVCRWGVATTVNAPKIDPGFSGVIVLELTNSGDYRFALRKGMAISQIMFFPVEGKIGKPYDETGRFGGQDDIRYSFAPDPLSDFFEITKRDIVPKEDEK